MKYASIKIANLEISQLSLGTWAFGGANWGGTKKNDAIAAVHAAIDQGMTLIDTAPIYGNGVSEGIVGEALISRRDKAILATKCGLVGRDKNVVICLKPDSIRKEIDESLTRLRTDYIDIYQCHWPDDSTPIEETMSCLNDLRAEGKIRYIGVSNFPLDLIKRAAAVATITTIQSPLSLLARDLQQEILPYCAEHHIGVLCYGPLGGGILTGKYKEPKNFPKDDARSFFYKFYRGEKFERVSCFLDRLRTLNLPLNQIALNWVRQQPGVSSVLAGCRDLQQVLDNVNCIGWDLNPSLLEFIDQALNECNL